MQESVDEMERKKEKIMLLSLQRRQQQEEAKARKEIDAMQRREKEREKEEERIRKREEQAARRAAILEQHKLKKAIEEAEQKGITLDRNDLLALKQQHSMLQTGTSSPSAPKMRTQKVVRPRPKTIHVETGSVDLSEASSLSSRNKKGSNSNLTGICDGKKNLICCCLSFFSVRTSTHFISLSIISSTFYRLFNFSFIYFFYFGFKFICFFFFLLTM